jgi:hypothetical protein
MVKWYNGDFIPLNKSKILMSWQGNEILYDVDHDTVPETKVKKKSDLAGNWIFVHVWTLILSI